MLLGEQIYIEVGWWKMQNIRIDELVRLYLEVKTSQEMNEFRLKAKKSEIKKKNTCQLGAELR